MTFYLFVTGCQQNIYDSTRITHLLNKMGYVLASEKNADLIIVIACSVRQKAVDRIWGKMRLWLKRPRKPQIIITGCLLPSDKEKMIKRGVNFIPANKIDQQLPKLLGNKLKIKNLKLKIEDKSNTFVPIMYGCNNFCTYCAVPYTRGREVSRPENEIIKEIDDMVKNGIKEVTLLGQNVNSYNVKAQMLNVKTTTKNSNRKSNFVKLLEKIEKINGLNKISFLTSHPKDMGNDLINWMAKSKKFSGELHLPLQSGDDEILRKMNRNYTAKHYFDLIKRLKSKVKSLSWLSTDIIVGFPGETKQQFENTYNLCKKINFDKAFISQFSPRVGTPAAKMKNDVLQQEKKRRWLKLDKLINKKAVG